MMSFQPDLIVEVTKVCDQKCPGCYAPNVTSKEDGKILAAISPGFFITSHSLEAALSSLGLLEHVAVRGGEPTRHPELLALLEAIHGVSQKVYLETHGRWILRKSISEEKLFDNLVPNLRARGTIVKLSFDSMHGLKSDQLRMITSVLDQNRIEWLVAITEPNEIAFGATRSRCEWIDDKRIIFQKKATSIRELIQPRLGVVNVNGIIVNRPTVKASFNGTAL